MLFLYYTSCGTISCIEFSTVLVSTTTAKDTWIVIVYTSVASIIVEKGLLSLMKPDALR